MIMGWTWLGWAGMEGKALGKGKERDLAGAV